MELKLLFVTVVSFACIAANPFSNRRRDWKEIVGRMYNMKGSRACLKVTNQDIVQISKMCMLKSWMLKQKIKDGVYPEPTEEIRADLDCVVNQFEIANDDGSINLEAYEALGEKYPLEGDENDIETMTEIRQMCKEELEEGTDATEALLMSLQCMNKKVMDECERRGEPVGLAFSIQNAWLSLGTVNEQCMKVNVPQDIQDTHDQCLEEAASDETNLVDKVMPVVMEAGAQMMKYISKIMQVIKEIPEIKCIKETSEAHDMMVDDKPSPEGMKNALMKFEGWSSNEVKETVINKLYECTSEFQDDPPLMMMMKTNECFLPTMTEQCSFDNKLAWDFLFPFLSYDRMGNIKMRLKKHFEESNVRKMMMEVME